MDGPDDEFEELDDDVEDAADVDDAAEALPTEADGAELIASARRRYGSGGALVAAGMLGLDIALGTKKKPDSVQVQEAPSEPIDVDKSGIQVMIDELTSVEAPPLDRREPLGMKKKRLRRR